MSPARRTIGPSYRANETPLLVGIVNRVKDWHLVKSEHWYRIPVKSAPPQLHAVEYLAFYLTKPFQDEKWAVSYYAPIRDVATALRRELLPDEPNHKRAGEPYYRIDIGELQRLPRPIPSRRWRRIIFIPTTLEKLLNAQEINDLFNTSPIEDRLHDALKRADVPAERQYLVREEDAGYMLDFAMFCRDGNLNVECDGDRYHVTPDGAKRDRARDNDLASDGWHILRFNAREINDDAAKCLRTIRRMLERLGGPDPAR
jgi:very-short-patch-repair endonuclease